MALRHAQAASPRALCRRARQLGYTTVALTDINSREFLMLSILAVAVLWMGVYPKPFTDVMQVSVTEFLRHVATSKLQ